MIWFYLTYSLLLSVLLHSVLADDYFKTPPANGPVDDFSTNPLYTVGDTHNLDLQWHTDIEYIDLWLWQCGNSVNQSLQGNNVYNQDGLTWTLIIKQFDLNNSTLKYPNVFYLTISKSGETSPSLTSHYFNLTSSATTTSVTVDTLSSSSASFSSASPSPSSTSSFSTPSASPSSISASISSPSPSPSPSSSSLSSINPGPSSSTSSNPSPNSSSASPSSLTTFITTNPLSGSALAATSTTATSSLTNVPPGPNIGGLSPSTKAGLGAGIGIGIPLLIIIGALIGWRLAAKRRNQAARPPSSDTPGMYSDAVWSTPQSPELEAGYDNGYQDAHYGQTSFSKPKRTYVAYRPGPHELSEEQAARQEMPTSHEKRNELPSWVACC